MRKLLVFVLAFCAFATPCFANKLGNRFQSTDSVAMNKSRAVLPIHGVITVTKEGLNTRVSVSIVNADKSPLRIGPTTDVLYFRTNDNAMHQLDLINAEYNKRIVNPSENTVVNLTLSGLDLMEKLKRDKVVSFIYAMTDGEISLHYNRIK